MTCVPYQLDCWRQSLLLLSLTVYDQCSFAIRNKAVLSSMLSMDRLVQHQILLKLGGSSPLHCDRVVARQVQFLFPFQRKYRFCDLYAIPGVGTHQSWSHSMHCQWRVMHLQCCLIRPHCQLLRENVEALNWMLGIFPVVFAVEYVTWLW